MIEYDMGQINVAHDNDNIPFLDGYQGRDHSCKIGHNFYYHSLFFFFFFFKELGVNC